MPSIRLTVHFTGRVQGVGFRYTAYRIAQRHPVAGFVQNLPDGRVLLVVEGDEAEATAYVRDVADAMSDCIANQKTDRSPATGQFGVPTRGALNIRH